MEAFVITLREGVEAALIIALVVTYLNRTGRQNLIGWVYAGLFLAVVASILGAFGLSRIGLDPESEVMEGVLYAVAAVLVVSLVIWMWRSSKGMKQQIEDRVEAMTSTDELRYGWGLLIFVLVMVFREGIETVLFLTALSLTRTPDLIGFLGGLAGLILAVAFGILFIRGSLRINLRRFFAVTSIVLLLLAVRLAAGSLHEFYEAGLISLPHLIEEGIEFITSKSTSTILLIILVALPLMAMLPSGRIRPVRTRDAR
ncbi:MAG TPA: FTR1 family protein [candidate division Zixibacteria bacterium]|nr:FTR1 family protein [candidate division Zixibacteria bacterium]